MDPMPAMKKRPTLSVRNRIWIMFVLVFLPANSLAYFLYYRYTVQNELKLLTTDLSNHIAGITATIDIENFKELYEQESSSNQNCPPKPGTSFSDKSNGYFPKNNLLFQKHMGWLKTVSQLDLNRSIYTYIPGPEPGSVIMISSSWYYTNPEVSFKFCQLYEAPTLYKSLTGRIDVWEPYHDEYGDWISTYVPLYDADGVVVGGVGVDVPASLIVDIERGLQVRSIIVLFSTVVISFLIAYALSEAISKRLVQLTRLTSNVQDSASIVDFSGYGIQRSWWHDEIETLFDSVRSMMLRLKKQSDDLEKSRSEMQELAQGVIRAQENERKYISRELHSEAGQLLTMMKTTLADILHEFPSDEKPMLKNFDHGPFRNRMEHAAQQIEETLGMVRALSHQMRPSLLDVGDVNIALNEYCSEFAQQQKVEVTYEGSLIPNMTEELAVSFYRFLQEALTNTSKHASATRIWVRAEMEGGWAQLSVEDNGRGDQSANSARGIGVAGLKERFFLLGGKVESRSITGGYLIYARAPLKRE